MSQSLFGKTILVTGASMGIGLACARKALEAGASVGMIARTSGLLDEAVTQLGAASANAPIANAAADVSCSPQLEDAFSLIENRLGPIDGVIHAAAILGPIGRIDDVDDAQWLETLQINLFGTFLVIQKATKRFRARGTRGRIVAFSGGGASAPWPNYSAYASSKVAVVRLVETAAQELASFGIEINAIAPGLVVTRMQEQTLAAGDRVGADYLEKAKEEIARGGVPPERAANLAAFLVSDAAQGITGKFISAVHDDWPAWPEHIDELRETDIFTLRRILPKERGMSWQ